MMKSPLYETLKAKYQPLSIREKVLLMLVAVVLVALPGWFQVIEPMLQQIQQQYRQQQSLRTQNQQLTSTIQELDARLSVDPNQSIKDSIASVDRQIQEQDGFIHASVKTLVPASQMATVLRSVLASSGSLEIETMTSIPPELLLPLENKVNFYRHGIRLTLKGSYTQVYQYLHQVEQLPQHFYWKRLDYQIDKYPVGKAVVELYTLSQNKEFIGG